ncbi:MAG: NAD(P)-dependent oxidoreductase [Pseudomonadota bacterium]
MTVILLGAQGRLGTLLGKAAQRADAGWLLQGRRKGVDVRWSGDPKNKEIFRPDATLINMIGLTRGTNEALEAANVTFVRDLLTGARATGLRHVILASSAAVYGRPADDGSRLKEEDALNPLSDYGRSKCAMEKVANEFANDLAITVLRIGNVAGADAIFEASGAALANRRPLKIDTLSNERTPLRSYICPTDLYRVVEATVRHTPDGLRCLNVAQPEPVALGELAEAYATTLFDDLTVTTRPADDAVLPCVVLSTDRLSEITPLPSRSALELAKDVCDLRAQP